MAQDNDLFLKNFIFQTKLANTSKIHLFVLSKLTVNQENNKVTFCCQSSEGTSTCQSGSSINPDIVADHVCKPTSRTKFSPYDQDNDLLSTGDTGEKEKLAKILRGSLNPFVSKKYQKMESIVK